MIEIGSRCRSGTESVIVLNPILEAASAEGLSFRSRVPSRDPGASELEALSEVGPRFKHGSSYEAVTFTGISVLVVPY